MSPQHIIISMDSRTHSCIDLKPYLPRRRHGDFDFAVARRRRSELSDFELTLAQRLAMIDADGVAGEFLLDGTYSVTNDAALLHEICLAYCRWFADYVSPAAHRFRGAVILDPRVGTARACHAIATAHELGLAAVQLSCQSCTATERSAGYDDVSYAPMWHTLDERGMTVMFREVAESTEARSGSHASDCAYAGCLRSLLLARLPERYPKVRFGWMNADTEWLMPLLAALDCLVKSEPESRAGSGGLPSEIWSTRCFTAGPRTARAATHCRQIGLDSLMFGTSFLDDHATYPRTYEYLLGTLGALTAEERFALCAGNAARVVGFDLRRLEDTPATRLNAQRACTDRKEPAQWLWNPISQQ